MEDDDEEDEEDEDEEEDEFGVDVLDGGVRAAELRL